MFDKATPAFSLGDTGSSDRWSVTVRPPDEYSDPRAAAEQLFTSLHGLGRVTFEIHSDGAHVALRLACGDRATADTVARHVRAELGAQASIEPADVPISSDDPITAATFRYERDTLFPIATTRTDDRDVGPLHHVLDTFAEDDVRGVFQVVAEPVEEWTTRRSRGLPESIAHERDIEREAKRAGAALVPLVGAAVFLSPWPIATSLCAALALLIAATVGEGVRLPRRRTAADIAHETREQAKDAHGARSRQAKNAKKAAEAIAEQGDVPGWRFSMRLVVAGDNAADSISHRDRLVNQVTRAYDSAVTGQSLVASTQNRRARSVLDDVTARRLDRITPAALMHRVLAHGTRRVMHAATPEIASLAYFADSEGGGSSGRTFATATSSRALPDGAPSYERPRAAADGGHDDSPEYLLDPDETETAIHPDYGRVETKVVEHVPGDDDEHYAGAFVRELVESSEPTGNVYLGHVEDGGQIQEIGITSDQLPQHLFIVGASGAGKTTLAEFLALQHAHAGRGFAVLDPHNDLVDDLKTKLPEHRLDDIIAIDPENLESEHTIAINFLDVELDPEDSGYQEAVNAAVSDVESVLAQGANAMGDRMKPIIRAISRGMIISEQDYTFLDMREFFTDEDERRAFARQMREEGHTYIADFADEVAEMSREDLAPITRLLNKWVMSPVSRQIIEHTESSFSFREAIDNNRIILLRNNLSDDDLQRLVATAFYRRIVRACCERPKGERETYPLIIDEVDDIESPEMNLGDDLGNARKWGVSLALMTQFPDSLSNIKASLETNCKTYVSYACPSPNEARTISSMFDCDQAAITKLGDYRSQIQIDVDGDRAGPFLTHSPAPYPRVREGDTVLHRIDEPSRERFGVERSAADDVDVVEADGGTPDTAIDLFLAAAADAASDGVLVTPEQVDEDDKPHYTFVHEGTSRETLRINPSRSIEALEEDGRDLAFTFDEIADQARDEVDDRTSYVTDHRQSTPPAGRCLGVDLDDVAHVDRGEFVEQ